MNLDYLCKINFKAKSTDNRTVSARWSLVIMEVSSALEVLRTAPQEELERHSAKITETLAVIKKRLQTHSHHRNSKQENDIEKLVKTLKEALPWILSLQVAEQEGLVNRPPGTRDQRLEDISRVEGKKENASNEDKLFRVLGLRALVNDFTNKQEKDGIEPLLQQYISSVSLGNDLPKQGRSGAVAQYVKLDPQISENDKAFACRAVNMGIKYRVVEEIFREKLRERQLPEHCEAITSGLSLDIHWFCRLRYHNIPSLLDLLFGQTILLQKHGVPTEMEERSVIEILASLSEWFNKIQCCYSECTKNSTEHNTDRLQNASWPFVNGYTSPAAVHRQTPYHLPDESTIKGTDAFLFDQRLSDELPMPTEMVSLSYNQASPVNASSWTEGDLINCQPTCSVGPFQGMVASCFCLYEG